MGMLKLLKNIFKKPQVHMDDGIKQFCMTEYGDDWQYAYTCYKIDNRFPRVFKSK
jgi:hypothetical protein